MKTNILKSAVLASILAMTACTTQIVEINPDLDNGLALGQGEDIIRIALTNTTNTRAARPIGTSKAENNVNRIAFKFLTNGTTEAEGISLEGVIEENTGNVIEKFGKSEGNILELPNDYDGSEICVKFSGLKKGSYKIIAYGYNYTSNNDTSDAFPYKISTPEQVGSNYLYKVTEVSTVQEIFAGCNEGTYIGVNQHGKFQTIPEITLMRQVAGLLAYFKEAPVFVNNTKVAKITVSTKAKVNAFYFPASLLDNSIYNGAAPESGTWQQNEYVNLLTFDMTNAENYNSNYLNKGDFYTFGNQDDDFLMAEGMNKINGLQCKENTLFGSCFLLAFPSHYDFGIAQYNCATLNICYWDVNENLIKSVPLRNGGSEDDSLNTNSYQYNILCNNFYSIGTKKALESDDESEDKPLSIDEPSGYDYAKVSINSNWDDIHDLVN